jgi:hypothetical protein
MSNLIINPYNNSISDPNFSSVVLLLGYEGADASTTITDESASNHAMTLTAGLEIDTAQQKFGGSSLLGNSTTNQGKADNSLTDFKFGTGQFTVETFVRFNSTSGDQTFLCAWSFNNAAKNIWYFYRQGGTLRFLANNAAVSLQTGAWTISTGVWYHVAVDRDGSNVIRLYIDGVKQASTTNSADITGTSVECSLGCIYDAAGSFDNLNGWLDESRITKGVARYATDTSFTVPTVAFPRH